MRATGVIRRIDELGRIVIPKEIRKNLRIGNGVSLEIFVTNDEIILKKHSPLKNQMDISQSIVDILYSSLNHSVIITDLSTIIAVSGPFKKDYISKDISIDIEESIKRREKILENYKKDLNIIEGKIETCSYAISTIVSNSDAVGTIIVFDELEKINDIDYKIINIVSNFIGKYLED